MIYLAILILILFGILNFDFKRFEVNYTLYYLIVLILILVSGLAYRMGDDGMFYEYSFPMYGGIKDISISYIKKYPYMPGWVILSTVCYNYVVFKFVHAVIVNLSVALVIKNNTRYPYLGLLFYFILAYFDFNFGIMRQSLSIGCFLLSLRYFILNKWWQYYFISLIALSFHDSAIVVFFLPLFKCIKLSKKWLFISAIFVVMVIHFAPSILQQIFEYTFSSDSALGRLELYKKDVEGNDVSFGFLNVLLNVVIPMIMLYKFSQRGYIPNYYLLSLVYIFSYIFSLFLPVLYRINLFFLIFCIFLWLDTFFYMTNYIARTTTVRNIFVLLLCLSFLCFKKRMLFDYVESTQIPQYTYIYPYTSIIFKERVYDRERLYSDVAFN